MSRASSQRGYALLAALVVTALAAVFAAAAVAAVSARQSIVGDDIARGRAQAAAEQALSHACLELRRHPAVLAGAVSRPADSADDAAWEASWSADGAALGTTGPAVVVRAQGSFADAHAGLTATLQLCPERVPQGVSTAGDVELTAPFRVTGSGLYCGGCLRGREWLELASLDPAANAATPPDGVHGDIWPLVGVHALGGVWAAGGEIHAAGDAPAAQATDTDMHTGANDVSRFVVPPETQVMVELRDEAVAPGEALVDDVLDLARLPLSRPLGVDVGPAADGYVVFLTVAEGAEVRVTGARPAGACPIVLAVRGDVAVGEEGVTTALDGALMVLGSVRICGPTELTGHLFANDLLVSAPLSVEVASGWRARQLAGLVWPVVTSLDSP